MSSVEVEYNRSVNILLTIFPLECKGISLRLRLINGTAETLSRQGISYTVIIPSPLFYTYKLNSHYCVRAIELFRLNADKLRSHLEIVFNSRLGDETYQSYAFKW